MVVVVDRETGEVIKREGKLDVKAIAKALLGGFEAWLEEKWKSGFNPRLGLGCYHAIRFSH